MWLNKPDSLSNASDVCFSPLKICAQQEKTSLDLKQFILRLVESLTNPVSQDWKSCQALCDTSALQKRIEAFDVNRVSTAKARECKQRLDRIEKDDVKATSQVAATFYLWVS